MRVTVSAVVLVVAAWSALGCGDGGRAERSGLEVEIAGPDLIVYLEDPAANVLDSTGGDREVVLECYAASGEVLLEVAEPWPFGETDGGRFAPHVHEPLREVAPQDLARCALDGTDGPLQGAASLAR